MTRRSCVGVGNNRPDGFNIALFAALVDYFGAGFRGEDECAGLGSTIAKDNAFSD